ncbi:MAG: response regulator [Candidatus Doudnabacteria bacterium]|nr:response regulator [Candidatus Doudnabacteria bacterium]
MPIRKRSKLILISEDDPDISELLETILESNGYETRVCMDGHETENQAKKLLPDLIIMDLWLPGIDGTTLTKKLKAKNSTKNIPILIVSAQNHLEKIVKQTRADGFLPKPFDLQALLSLVKKHLAK